MWSFNQITSFKTENGRPVCYLITYHYIMSLNRVKRHHFCCRRVSQYYVKSRKFLYDSQPDQVQKMVSVFFTSGLVTILIIISSTGTVLGDLVTAAIPVGEFPQALIFNPSNNDTYVSNRDSGTVSVIDSTSNSVIKNITVGSSPGQLLFNPSNNNMYVANRDSGTVSVIDSTNNALENVVVGSEPVALEFNPSNNNIYVANVVSNSVSMIENTNNTVTDTVNVSSLPIALEFNPSNGSVYVAGTLTGTEGLVSVIG